MRLHNYGHSPAYNVRFQQTEFRLEGPDSGEWRLKLETVDVVPPEGDTQILLQEPENESEYDRVDSVELFRFINGAGFAGDSYSFKTTAIYDDILGHKWSSELGMSSIVGIIAKKPSPYSAPF